MSHAQASAGDAGGVVDAASAPTALSFVIPASDQGIALTAEMQGTLAGALKGGQATAAYFANQNQIAKFAAWVNAKGKDAWTFGTDDHGSPTYIADNGAGTTMVLATEPATDAINGTASPTGFPWGGQTYNMAGSMTGTLSYNQQQLWTIEVPLGLAEAIPITILAKYTWAGLVQPLLTGFWNGVVSCFSGAAEASTLAEAGEAAAVAATDAAVEAVVVEGVAVSMTAGVGALVGLAVLIALPFVIDVILHPSFQNLMVYNLTPFDMTWSLAFVNEGSMTMAPIISDDDTDFDYDILAMGAITPPGGGLPVNVAHEASFSFASGSLVRGLGYVMSLTLTDPSQGGQTVGSVMGMIDVPWSGSNSLAVAIDSSDSGQAFYSATSGRYEQTSQVATGQFGTLPVTATINYDYLTGEHKTASGSDAYSYNSMLVVQTAAATGDAAGA